MSKDQLSKIVSRETMTKFERYVQLLESWNKSLNLISSKTAKEIWQRHIYDSAQILSCLSSSKTIIDFGTGGGFPGLVLAMMGPWDITLIESDTKKCSFLKEVARQTDTKITILNQRIETVKPWQVDVITVRALAPLNQLLNYASPFLLDKGVGIFLKGKMLEAEIEQARLEWTFNAEVIESKTSCEGRIIKVKDIKQLSGEKK
ncbi:MAG: 16S rRNA (guanine(527)-N(7))-methyltransferase RsmG [Alphaproteobacteria bacterium]|nr:16S rRNA (guanine(527)-N(7))-methyltransferase RsmG [Alphaproteobacteria bacterium]